MMGLPTPYNHFVKQEGVAQPKKKEKKKPLLSSPIQWWCGGSWRSYLNLKLKVFNWHKLRKIEEEQVLVSLDLRISQRLLEVHICCCYISGENQWKCHICCRIVAFSGGRWWSSGLNMPRLVVLGIGILFISFKFFFFAYFQFLIRSFMLGSLCFKIVALLHFFVISVWRRYKNVYVALKMSMC